MASSQTPDPSTALNPLITDAPRGADALSLDRLRGAVPIAEHAAQLAAQAQLEAIMRDLEVSNAKVRDLEAVASKTAVIEQAQRHEFALADRKNSLEMARHHQQWRRAHRVHQRGGERDGGDHGDRHGPGRVQHADVFHQRWGRRGTLLHCGRHRCVDVCGGTQL